MPGDWIKVECATPDKPEVYAIANMLDIDPDAVTGKLVRLWSWMDQQSLDGHAPGVTHAAIDRIANATGFGESLDAVGWSVTDGLGITFLHFGRHNGQSAKSRALASRRKAAQRAREERERLVRVAEESRRERDTNETEARTREREK